MSDYIILFEGLFVLVDDGVVDYLFGWLMLV